MNKLMQLQSRFCASLDPFARPEVQHAGAKLVRSGGSLTATARLDVYRRNVSGTHIGVLEQLYPACGSILGDSTFSALARDYTWHELDSDADLNRYGATWPAFAAARVEAHDYLYDLGRLEFAWNQVWFAANDPPFDFTAFGTLATRPDRLVLRPSASLHLIHSEWPIQAIWQHHRDGKPAEPFNRQAGPAFVVISRSAGVPEITAVDEAVFTLLDALRHNMTLTELETDPRIATALERLPELISNGWLCGCRDIGDV